MELNWTYDLVDINIYDKVLAINVDLFIFLGGENKL